MQEVLSSRSQVRGGVGGSNIGCLSGSALGSAHVGLEEVGRGRGTVRRRPRWRPGGWNGPSVVFPGGAGVGPGPLTSLEGCGWLNKGVTPESWLPSGTNPGAAESFRLSLLQDALVPRGVGQAGAG